MFRGIVIRFVESVKFVYWGDDEKIWIDLYISNLLLIDLVVNIDVLFYKDLIFKCGKVKVNYFNGGKFWCMSLIIKLILVVKVFIINVVGVIVIG